MEHFTNRSSCVVVATCWFLGFLVWERTYVFSLYHNPDVDSQIFDCLQTAMAAVQAKDVHASFLLWVIWMAIVRSGCVLQPQIVMVLQPLTLKLCLVMISWCRPSHAHIVTIDLLMTDVPDLVCAEPIGNSDHSCLSVVISMGQAATNVCVSRKGSLNIMSSGIQFVVQYRICPGITFGLLTILLKFGMCICRHWLDVIFQSRSSKALVDDQCRHVLGLKQEAHLWWTHDHNWINRKEFFHCQMRANKTNSEAKHQFCVRNEDVLINAQSPHKWWSTLSMLCMVRLYHCNRLILGVVTAVRVGW